MPNLPKIHFSSMDLGVAMLTNAGLLESVPKGSNYIESACHIMASEDSRFPLFWTFQFPKLK